MRKVIGMKDPDPSAAEELAQAEKAKPACRRAARRATRRIATGRRRHSPRGGAAPPPRDPQPGHCLGQQPARPHRGHRRGRPACFPDQPGRQGVVVGHQTRLGVVGLTKPVLHDTGQPSPARVTGTMRTTRSSTTPARLIATTSPTRSSASSCCARARTPCRPWKRSRPRSRS